MTTQTDFTYDSQVGPTRASFFTVGKQVPTTDFILFGSLLSIVDYTNLNTIFTTTGLLAAKTMTYLQCSSAALCVATDDGTAQVTYYKLVQVDMIANTATFYTVSHGTGEKACGIGHMPSINQVYISIPSRVYFFNAATGASIADSAKSGVRFTMTSFDDSSNGVYMLWVYGRPTLLLDSYTQVDYTAPSPAGISLVH